MARTQSQALSKVLAILRQGNQQTLRLTVRALVGFGRFPHSQGRMTTADLQQVDDALAYLRLMPLAERYLDEFSGGQRQCAYIAMVLCQDTPNILLDEPLNNLDLSHAVRTMQLPRSMVDERGKTVVVVLHDINFASCYADHTVAMQGARVAHRGTPLEVVRDDVLNALYGIAVSEREVQGRRLCHCFA